MYSGNGEMRKCGNGGMALPTCTYVISLVENGEMRKLGNEIILYENVEIGLSICIRAKVEIRACIPKVA